jgi:hypothetical protein
MTHRRRARLYHAPKPVQGVAADAVFAAARRARGPAADPRRPSRPAGPAPPRREAPGERHKATPPPPPRPAPRPVDLVLREISEARAAGDRGKAWRLLEELSALAKRPAGK